MHVSANIVLAEQTKEANVRVWMNPLTGQEDNSGDKPYYDSEYTYV